MSFESRDHEIRSSFTVDDAIVYVREAFGTTYSGYRLNKDIAALGATTDLSDALREKITAYNANPRLGIAREILDAIIARSIPPAPEGYIGLDELRKQAGCSPRLVAECLPQFLRIRGFAPDAHTNINAWRAGGEALKTIFVYGRSRKNGDVSIFFSPEARRDLVRFLQEKQREQGEDAVSISRANKPPSVSSKGAKATSKPSWKTSSIAQSQTERPNPAAPLLARVDKINRDDLSPAEQVELQKLRVMLTGETPLHPRDGQYTAQRISALEASARRNQDD